MHVPPHEFMGALVLLKDVVGRTEATSGQRTSWFARVEEFCAGFSRTQLWGLRAYVVIGIVLNLFVLDLNLSLDNEPKSDIVTATIVADRETKPAPKITAEIGSSPKATKKPKRKQQPKESPSVSPSAPASPSAKPSSAPAPSEPATAKPTDNPTPSPTTTTTAPPAPSEKPDPDDGSNPIDLPIDQIPIVGDITE